MASLEELSQALINADAAGDADGARILAGEIQKIRQQPSAPKAPEVSTATDIAKSAGVGLGRGSIGLAGLVGDITDLGAKGLRAAESYISDKIGIEPYKPPVEPGKSVLDKIPTSESITKAVEGVTGEFYKPQTTAGQYAQTIGEFAPGVIGGPGSLGARMLRNVVAPAVTSEAAGQATEGTSFEPWARAGGALAAPAALAGARRAVTPLPAEPSRQRLVDILQGEGVTSLTAGQRTGNKSLQYAESVLGDAPGAGAQASRMQNEAQEQFTRAAMRRAGGGADASPDVLMANNDRLGQQFRDMSARNSLTPDNDFITDLTAAVRNYRNVPESQQRAMIQGYIDDIIPHVNAGSMPGEQYQAMRSRLSRQAQNNRMSDPDLSEALRGMRDALDNAMGRSISPIDREAWNTARREYGAQKTIENATSRAGAVTAEGQITPQNLRNVASVQNRGAYARGQGDFSELARAGAGVMAPLPQSGTAPRLTMQAIASMIGGVAGAGAGPAGSGLGAAAAGVAGPAIAGRILMSRPTQAYLANQLVQPGLPDNARDAIVRAILARREISTLPASQDSRGR